MQREWPPGWVEVRGKQAPAWFGDPVHLAEGCLPLPGGNVVYRERAGDDVELRVRQVQVLGGTDRERHGGERAPAGVGDRRRRGIHAGDVAGRPRGGGELVREIPAARPDVEDGIPRPYAGQGDDPPVHAAAAPPECDLADHLVQPEALDRRAPAALPRVQALERVVHENLPDGLT